MSDEANKTIPVPDGSRQTVIEAAIARERANNELNALVKGIMTAINLDTKDYVLDINAMQFVKREPGK